MTRVVMLSLHTSPLAQAGAGDAGGLNTFVDYLSRSLRMQGADVDIVTTTPRSGRAPASGSTRVLEDGRRLHIIGADPARPLIDQTFESVEASVRLIMGTEGPPVDVVHSHYWISGAAGLVLAERLGSPLVHTMHTVAAVKRERDPHLPHDPRREAWEHHIARTACVTTANTGREAEDLSRLYPECADRIRLLRPGVDLSIFRPESPLGPPAEDESEPRPAPVPLRLTFAGRLQPHKGPQVAVATAGLVRRLRPDRDVTLTVAGQLSGPLPLDVAVLAEEAGVSDVLVQRGPLGHRALAELFRGSDLVLMPSYSESFGFVALEAMACGTPVAAHAVGGLTELIDDGVDGLLLESLEPDAWAHAVTRAAEPARLAEMGRAAAEAARGYSWSSTASQALSIYRASRDLHTGS
ncbi:MAG: glycosyltransferase [Nesterenkonia sp.]|nr:glycosyltransferase [Nesterenkonia sp.]